MDSLQNYQNLRQQAQSTSQRLQDIAASKVDEAKKRITDVTNTFGEGLTQQSGDRLLSMGVNKLASTIRGTKQQAQRLQQIYKEGGTRGVINDIKQKLNIGQVKIGDSVPEQSIASLDKDSFRGARTSIRLSLEQDLDGFSAHQKNVFSRLLQDNVKDEVDIPSKLDRLQHNLQQSSNVMEHVKANVPRDISDPTITTNDADDIQMKPLNEKGANIHSLDDALDEFHDAAETPDEVKEYNMSQRPPPAAPADEIQPAKPEPPHQPDIPEPKNPEITPTEPESGENLLKKGLKEGAETDAEGGGPEDIAGDIAGLAVGLGVFLGGMRASHHVQQSPQAQIQNFTSQEGA